MNKPENLLFDTCILINLFNTNPQTEDIRQAIYHFLDEYKQCARLILDSNLIELFYKLQGKMSPAQVGQNLQQLCINRFPMDEKLSGDIFTSFLKQNEVKTFDYADYNLCHTALYINMTLILTIDNRDLKNAYSFARNTNNFNQSQSRVECLQS